MKYIIMFCIGAAVGVCSTKYVYDKEFADATNAHLDSAVTSAATSAHTALAGKN
jgi:hypothetical protein